MTKKKTYLACDIGASHGRVFAADFNGETIRLEEKASFPNSPVWAGNTLSWDFPGLFRELCESISRSVSEGRKPESLGIDTWGVDFGIVDQSGRLIAQPLHYRDNHRSEVFAEVLSILDENDLFRHCGTIIWPIGSVFNLYALKKQNAVEYIHGSKCLFMPDLFNSFLTGRMLNEYTIASTSLMYDISERSWSEHKPHSY